MALQSECLLSSGVGIRCGLLRQEKTWVELYVHICTQMVLI